MKLADIASYFMTFLEARRSALLAPSPVVLTLTMPRVYAKSWPNLTMTFVAILFLDGLLGSIEKPWLLLPLQFMGFVI